MFTFPIKRMEWARNLQAGDQFAFYPHNGADLHLVVANNGQKVYRLKSGGQAAYIQLQLETDRHLTMRSDDIVYVVTGEDDPGSTAQDEPIGIIVQLDDSALRIIADWTTGKKVDRLATLEESRSFVVAMVKQSLTFFDGLFK